MDSPVVYLSRSEWFSASHRLHNPNLSDEDNRAIFGKCNNPNGHGHNYRVKVTVRGKVDPVTGMVANIQLLKNLLAKVLEPLDHHHLDADIPYFKNVISTTENLCVYIWSQLKDKLTKSDASQGQFELYEVKIYETEKNCASYREFNALIKGLVIVCDDENGKMSSHINTSTSPTSSVTSDQSPKSSEGKRITRNRAKSGISVSPTLSSARPKRQVTNKNSSFECGKEKKNDLSVDQDSCRPTDESIATEVNGQVEAAEKQQDAETSCLTEVVSSSGTSSPSDAGEGSDSPKRKRGRPRKSTANSPSVVGSPKGKRGRPRKTVITEDDDSAPSRKRGRPRKSDIESEDSNDVGTPASPVKRVSLNRSSTHRFDVAIPRSDDVVAVFSSASDSQSGACKLCANDPFYDDIVHHCALKHCILVSRSDPRGCRDAASLSTMLGIAKRLTCQNCKQYFRSTQGFMFHEARCGGSEDGNKSFDDETLDRSPSDNSEDNTDSACYTLPELETLFAKKGYLRCSRCKHDYRSGVSYFVKHIAACSGKRRRSQGAETLTPRKSEIAEFPPPCSRVTDGSVEEDSPMKDKTLKDVELTSLTGHTLVELEEKFARDGSLTCPSCKSEYKSTVSYYIKHLKQCKKTSTDTDGCGFDKSISEFPKTPVPGKCSFCPDDRPPVEDMFRHYAIEHCVLFTKEPPGWNRSAEALDIILRLTGKLSCQYCGRVVGRSGNGLIMHERRCHKKSNSEVSQQEPDLSENIDDNSLIDGHTIEELEEMKNRLGYLTCSRCKTDYRSPVLYFARHYLSCAGQARKVPNHLLDSLANGECCGDGPYICHLCDAVKPFDDSVQLQNHYMQKHAALYAPDWAGGIRTTKARDTIIKKLGKVVCPKCGAAYKVGASFMYHEKVCAARDESRTFQTTFANLVDKVLSGHINCPLCSDHKAVEAVDIQNHYMETHCAIYDPSAGARCALDSEEALEFIMQRLGYLCCPVCQTQYRTPIWFFKKHRDSCHGDLKGTAESAKLTTEGVKNEPGSSTVTRKRRQAAQKAKELIAGLASEAANDDDERDEDDDSRDKNFEGVDSKESEQTSTSSGAAEEISGDEDASVKLDSSKIDNSQPEFLRKPFYVRNFKDLQLKNVVQDMNQAFYNRFCSVDSNEHRPSVTLPARLAALKSEFKSWTVVESPNTYLHSSVPAPPFRFASDPPDLIHKLPSFTGTTSVNEGENDAVFNVGGHVFAFDAAPLRFDEEAPQTKNLYVWIAVSAASSPDPDMTYSTVVPSAVQLWRVPIECINERLLQPRHVFSYAVEAGPVLALKFCPLAPAMNSIGLLAIGGSGQNLISIVALPSENEFANNESGQEAPLFTAPASLNLQINEESGIDRMSPEPDSSAVPRRVTCLDWSLDAAVLVAATSDAIVAVWNLESLSPLFSMGSACTLVAARIFRAHSQPLVAVCLAPYTKTAIITLSIDGAVSLFNAGNGQLLNSVMSPYSTHITIMPGNSIPILVNNPWFIFRRIPSLPGHESTPKKDGQSRMVNAPVISSLSAVDLFGESPASDSWPFKPILSGGSISCIGAIKQYIPKILKMADKTESGSPCMAIGFVTGNTAGDVMLYSAVAHIIKIRTRISTFPTAAEKLVCRAHLLTDGTIEFGIGRRKSGEESKTEDDPVGTAIAPPAANSLSQVHAIQLPDKHPLPELRHATPRVLIASVYSRGLCRLTFANCSSITQVNVKTYCTRK